MLIERKNTLKWHLRIFPIGLKATIIGIVTLTTVFFLSYISLALCARNPTCGTDTFPSSVWGIIEEDLLYCEKDNENSFIKERRNSLTSLFYFYFGSLVIFFGASDIYFWRYEYSTDRSAFISTLIYFPFLSIMYGFSLAYIGFGSFSFHSYPNEVSASHDRAGIFLVFLVAGVFTVVTKFRYGYKLDEDEIKRNVYIALGVAVLLGIPLMSITFTRIFKKYRAFIFPLLGGVVVSQIYVLTIRQRSDVPIPKRCLRLLALTVFLFFFGGIFQEEYIIAKCYPKSFFQRHAVWHVCTAFGFMTYYLSVRLDGGVYPPSLPLTNSLDKTESVL